MTAPDQFADAGRGIRLCYQTFGESTDPAIVLICGLGQQRHTWPDGFVTALTGRGFHVIRFDNRDVGRSTHMSFPAPGLAGILRGGSHPAQYHLGDMARDTIGLLDALGYRNAHLVGMSMGGMIAQTATAHYPGRVRTLTSIMSTTGAPSIGRPAPSTIPRMMAGLLRPARTRATATNGAEMLFRHIGSHGYPFDAARVRETAGIAFDRDPSGARGTARQLAAVIASGDRTYELAHIDVPTLVLHGDRDPMVHPSGGAATAAAIPGARLETIPGMGHDLPAGTWEHLANLISTHISQAASAAPQL